MKSIIFLFSFIVTLQSFGGAENDLQIFSNKAAEYFCEKFQNIHYSKDYFNELYNKCRQVRDLENAKINQSNIGKFAEKYMEWYRENKITIKVTHITYKKAQGVKHSIVFENCFLSNNDKREATVEVNKHLANEEVTTVIDSSITVKPWDKPYLRVTGRTTWHKMGPGVKRHSVPLSFNPNGGSTVDFAPQLRGSGLAYFNVTFEIVAGKTFTLLLNDVFGTEKPDIDAIKGSDDDE